MKTLLLIALSLSFTAASAQHDSIPPAVHSPFLIAKFDLANLVNFRDPSVLVGVEVFPFNRWVSIGQQIGFVTNFYDDDAIEVVSSLKYRGELRTYFNPANNDPKALNVFMAGSYQYRALTIRDNYILGYECDGDCLYYQNFDEGIPTTRHVYQMHMGLQSRINRMVFETGAGIGMSHLRIDRDAINHAQIVEVNRYLSESNLRRKLYVSVQVKIGCILFKR